MGNERSGAPKMWQEEGDGLVRCLLCHHRCRLREGGVGRCGVRRAVGGEMTSLVYGRVVAANIDPIEKKPLYHVLPGSRTYSIATLGCNFTCRHCQNAAISQVGEGAAVQRSGVAREPGEIVAAALAGGCRSISYTYVEPTVFFEYAYDCSLLAVQAGLGNIFVSNGYMTGQAIDHIAPLLTAINIDLKAWDDDFYRHICGGSLQPVLDSIARCRERGVWVEVTTLLIPGVNDGDGALAAIADFLVSLDANIPWHVSAYHPAHLMWQPGPTPAATLVRARDIGLARGLRHVYTGNRAGCGGEDTMCPQCGLVLIARQGYRIGEMRLVGGRCPACGTSLAGVWQ